MARFLVLFVASSFLVGCGKAKHTSKIERHKEYPYGLGEGGFYEEGESKRTPMLALIEKNNALQAIIFDWNGETPIIVSDKGEHVIQYKSSTFEVTYEIEGIAGSIVMTRTGRRLDPTTSTWEPFSEVHGLKGAVGDSFMRELGLRLPDFKG